MVLRGLWRQPPIALAVFGVGRDLSLGRIAKSEREQADHRALGCAGDVAHALNWRKLEGGITRGDFKLG